MSGPAKILPFFHVAAAAWLLGMGAYGVLWPSQYELLMQEDRAVEWLTVCLFLMSAAAGLLSSVGRRRIFDGLVALFCLFVAGEEISWGQRLFGYYPTEFFLENNFQQETNLHNLPQTFLQPKWVLIIVLGCYGILLPTLPRRPLMRDVIARIRATPPPLALVPWFTAAIVLLVWYPLSFTGEWVEAFSGALFLMSSGASTRYAGILLASAVALAPAMSTASGYVERERDDLRIACAEQEVRNLVSDIGNVSQGGDLWQLRRIHKRLWTFIREGNLQPDELRAFNGRRCMASATESEDLRQQYGIDPWGSPYWVEIERLSDAQRNVTVYSFGPDRRRDPNNAGGPLPHLGDDIRAAAIRHVNTN